MRNHTKKRYIQGRIVELKIIFEMIKNVWWIDIFVKIVRDYKIQVMELLE